MLAWQEEKRYVHYSCFQGRVDAFVFVVCLPRGSLQHVLVPRDADWT